MALHLAYRLTPALKQLFAAWDAGVVAEGPVVQHRWTDIALWPAARSATVAGSTGIEGNPLDAGEVDDVLAGHPRGRPADIREVLNYDAALDLANRAALRDDFEWSQELLRRLNAAVLDGLEDDARGEYRSDPVTVGGVYQPPAARLLPSLMRELVAWLRSDDGTDHTLLRAGLTHLNVVAIHPWLDGNGRTARVAGSLALMRRGVAAPELVNIESWICARPQAYARVLQETHGPTYQPEEHAATAWLEYFSAICVERLELRNRLLAAAQVDIGALVLHLHDRSEPATWAPIALAAAIGTIRTASLAPRLGLSTSRTRAVLAAMAAGGWIEPLGERRGRTYRAGPRLAALNLRAPGLMERLRAGAAQD